MGGLLKTQANQDVKRKLPACFVLAVNETAIQGYYTLSSSSIPLEHFPYHIQKKFLKSYKSIPATLLGRLAVDKKHQNKGIGRILLIDALKKSFKISHEIGSFAVVVDPIDEFAEAFYEKFDFIPLADSKKMFISIGILKELFSR